MKPTCHTPCKDCTCGLAFGGGFLAHKLSETSLATNSNFAPDARPAKIKRLSAQDAVALAARRYKGTLDLLA